MFFDFYIFGATDSVFPYNLLISFSKGHEMQPQQICCLVNVAAGKSRKTDFRSKPKGSDICICRAHTDLPKSPA